MVTKIRHTGIVVTDMEKALKFYRDLLGLKVAKDFKEEGDYIDSISGLSAVRLRMVKLTADNGTMVELLQYLSHPREAGDNPQICDIGCSHIAFTVNDIDKEYGLSYGFSEPESVTERGLMVDTKLFNITMPLILERVRTLYDLRPVDIINCSEQSHYTALRKLSYDETFAILKSFKKDTGSTG